MTRLNANLISRAAFAALLPLGVVYYYCTQTILSTNHEEFVATSMPVFSTREYSDFSNSTNITLSNYALSNPHILSNPLPAPRNITWGTDGPIIVSGDLSLTLNGFQSATLSSGFERFWKSVTDLKWYPVATEEAILGRLNVSNSNHAITEVLVYVDDTSALLQLGVNETYTLSVLHDSDAIEIHAATIWGALNAFTTLQQVIVYENDLYFVEDSLSIWDAPLYPHRGVMIDTGRNFILKKKIFDQIDIMSLSKLNTLHWHLDDTQLWPVEIKSIPEMTKDAYSPREIYTQSDLLEIIAYAKDRNVRVIPEVDMPGHTASGWKQANPNIVVCADTWWADAASEPGPGQLDILNNDTYRVVKSVYDELSALFEDDVFHVGGDEVNPRCYSYLQDITQYLQTHSYENLLDHWLDNAMPIFRNSDKRRLMMWEDAVTGSIKGTSIPKDVILQLWNAPSNIKLLTSDGYDVVVLLNMHFYLDCGYGGFLSNDPRYLDEPANNGFNYGDGGLYCNPYKTWQRIYDYDFTDGLTPEEESHVLGAEVALWSEQVDSAVITQKLWPRSAALGELVWSGNKDSAGNHRASDLTQRINNFREYLVALGYDASPLMPKYCVLQPHACDYDKNTLW